MKPLLAFYGDDFTGSADAMEVLQWAGLRTVLFIDPPSREQITAFENLRGFGVASTSRTMTPAEMQAEVQPAFEALRESGAGIVHYKTCSTFDSSPQIGSIGKAMELGRAVFGPNIMPMMLGAPNLGRYQVFANLFARSGLDTEPFRLDRHPTMQQHPITPMAEADVREHLALQTNLKVDLFDCLRLNRPESVLLAESPRPRLEDRFTGDALLFDVLYPEHLPRIGGAIQALVDATADAQQPRFVVGSSGIEYALVDYWSQSGRLEAWRSHPPGLPTFAATDQLVVITGSCSPVNDRQITWAEQHGFESQEINAARMINPASCDGELNRVIDRALGRLRSGANVIIHSARGPRDPRLADSIAAFKSLGFSELDVKLHSGRVLGPKLGRILNGILGELPVARVGVAGGDTSGYVARELGLTALEAIAAVAPGSPLCRAYSDNRLNSTEFFFKGGQVGKDDVWGTMLHGTH